MRFLKLLKLHRQILTPSPTKPVTDVKHERMNTNYFYEFVPNRNQHSKLEEIANILVINLTNYLVENDQIIFSQM